MNLIPAKDTDIPEIFRLAKKIWDFHYIPMIGKSQVDYMMARIYSQEGLLEQMFEKKHRFYLIESEGVNVGFVSVSGDHNLFIHKFYIDQDYQRRGLGEKVFQKLKTLHPLAKKFELTVNRKNFKSINFYFKLGFKIDRVEDFDIGEGYEMNDFIMIYSVLSM